MIGPRLLSFGVRTQGAYASRTYLVRDVHDLVIGLRSKFSLKHVHSQLISQH
jgi:hypothetical protein